jgi:hypothetical protein
LQKLALVGGVAALGLGAWLVVHSSTSHAADHLDSPTLATNPMADINDVYAWMTPDLLKVNLAMSISPGDDGSSANMPPSYGSTRHFGPSILYVFHVTSLAQYGMAGQETDVICKLASDTSAECWVGTADYVQGDPSNPAGITSTDGKIRLFAGLRSDPFFFNLQGFRDAISLVETSAGTLTFDTAGCPQLNDTTGLALRTKLQEGAQAGAAAPCATNSADCFAHLNSKVIVLQIDKNLLNLNNHTLLSVWASTHMAG